MAAWPAPTERSVTAGAPVAPAGPEYSEATVLAPASAQTSAVPWNCIVSPVIPAPASALM